MNEKQKALARHALGLDGEHRVSYRNWFVAEPGSGDYEAWTEMVSAGLADRHDDDDYGSDDLFWLTAAGAKAALSRGEKLDPEDFPGREEP